jgi:Cellulase (glycosyl hydrolase family 5)
MPTWLAMRAWQILARRYRANPQVIFDIWNEPHVSKWGFWRNGGVRSGVRYYGMERLASWIRGNGAHNMLWVEGRYTAGSLWGLPRWHLTRVGPVAYVVHHPPAPHDAASWQKALGYLVGRYPVADDEWTNYSRSNAGWACWSDGLTTVPKFLAWLAGKRLGMIAFNLTAPRLVESRDPSDPTYMRKDRSCTTGLNEGAGHRIMSWFRIHNWWF